MKLVELVDTSRRVSDTSSRLEKVGALAELLRRAPPDEIEIAIAFLSGATRQGRIGIGWSVMKGARPDNAAEAPSLELGDVDRAFAGIAAIGGAGSSREKTRALHALFAQATKNEQDFLFRLLIGELRQGALEGVLLDAVARASNIGSAAIRRATMLAGDLGVVARAALEHGETALAAFSVHLFQPVQPMLADTAETIEQAIGSLGEAALEYKMDGARIQVHKAGGDVRVFTRNLRDVTPAAPEIVEAVSALPARELILDGEVIALSADGTPHPFQLTMRRFGRKLEVAKLREELPLSPFFFDCLYQDGQTLIDEPQSRRFAALAGVVPGGLIVPHSIARTAVDADGFLRGALERGHEGVMAKALDAGYAAGRRGASWLKLKVARTLDLVVLAAEWGHGRRTGWLSNLHLGARDPERNSFVMLGKTFKGMTDRMLEWQTEKLLALELTRDDYAVYVRPELVVEVAFNDVQVSPVYPGGLALRFARDQAVSHRQVCGGCRYVRDGAAHASNRALTCALTASDGPPGRGLWCSRRRSGHRIPGRDRWQLCVEGLRAIPYKSINPLQRLEKREQRFARVRRQCVERTPHALGLAAVPCDRIVDGRLAAIVQQRPTESQAPERRRADLLGERGRLRDLVSSTDVVEKEVGEERYRLSIEGTLAARAGRQHRRMTRRTSDTAKQLLTERDLRAAVAARRWGQKLHERREVVDAAPARRAIDAILGIGHGIAALVLFRREPDAKLLAEQIVGDPHLVAISIGAEGEQRRVLRLPPESANSAIAGGDIANDGGTSADAVGVGVFRIRQRDQRLVGDRFHQPGAKQRNRNSTRDDHGRRRELDLAAMQGDREELKERLAVGCKGVRPAAGVTPRGANLADRAGAADNRHVVADGAARAVEGRSQTFFGCLDFEKVVEPETELLEIDRRDAGERLTEARRLRPEIDNP